MEGALRWRLPDGSLLSPRAVRDAALSDGRPIIVDGSMRPGSLLGEYVRERNLDLQPESILQYAYELLIFEEFLSRNQTDAKSATPRHLHLYRAWRTQEQEAPIGPSAWRRAASAIRGYLRWVAEKERLQGCPADGGIFRSPLWGSPVPDEKIRALTSDEWRSFRDFGIRGYSTTTETRQRRQLLNSGRLRLGAEIALTTGMRLQEFSTLTLIDVKFPIPRGSKVVTLEACAKYGAFRTVTLIPRIQPMIDLYIRSERAMYAERATRSLKRKHKNFFVVQSIQQTHNPPRVVGTVNGTTQQYHLHRIPPDLRRIMVHEGPAGLEFLSLFLSRTGEPLSRHSWFRDFRLASERALDTKTAVGTALTSRVRPHDLRHTFAVQLLRHLMSTLRRSGNVSTENLQDHLVWNPILTVQRMLGHRQPSTTLKYLRYVESLDGVLTDAWEGWEDPSFSFTDYADFLAIGN